MKDKDVIEGNELIAQFIGYKYYSYIRQMKRTHGSGWIKGDALISEMNKDRDSFLCFSSGDMKYHSSWAWLMPVVEKANKVNAEMQKKAMRGEWDDGEDKDLDDPTGWRAWSYRSIHLSTNIKEVWTKTVQFIQWYYQTKQQQQ